jgi:hypothetical protein
MAVIQISKIQHRRGLNADLPQLSSAELGWVIDERKLYVGNGTTSEGAPAIGNTEILTQYSDILGSINSYTYKGAEVGYTAQTTSSGASVQRSLQSKLDDVINAKDFGIDGDGVTDQAAKINFMLNQVYSREHTNPESLKTVYFPAGTYVVSDSIKFPRNSDIVGDGAGSTIFKRTTSAGLVGETSDSKQQTGANVGIGGALKPKNINITGVQFYNSENDHNFLVDQSNMVTFTNVRFKGRHVTNPTSIGSRKAGVVITQTTATDTKNVKFENCDFAKLDLALDCDHDVTNIIFNNCYIHDNFAGIIVGNNITGASPSVTGPRGVKVSNCLFEIIYKEAIKTTTVQEFSSSFNTFKTCGVSGIASGGTPTCPIINFDSDNNISFGDAFDRTTSQQATFPNIENNGKSVFGLIAGDKLSYGLHTSEAGKSTTLTDNTSVATNTTIDFDSSVLINAVIDFVIERGNARRTGQLHIAGSNTQGYSFEQDFTENSDPGVGLTFDSVNGTVQYTSTSTGSDGTLKYRITKFS